MKNPFIKFLIIAIIGFSLSNCSQSNTKANDKSQSIVSTSYDSVLAREYGADQYRMKKYVIAFLKRGPNRSLDKDKANELQMAHMNNIDRMAEEGKLVLAGPFFGNDDLRGIYIFNVESIEEAKALTNSDPAIKAGSLVMELKEWYGSAALMAINDLHKSLSASSISDE